MSPWEAAEAWKSRHGAACVWPLSCCAGFVAVFIASGGAVHVEEVRYEDALYEALAEEGR